MKVLVIEDNESVASMLEMFFMKEGIDGEFVSDGLEGLERSISREWDVIIIDCDAAEYGWRDHLQKNKRGGKPCSHHNADCKRQ